jgi:hypothetical protein
MTYEVVLGYYPDKRLAVAKPAPGGALLLTGRVMTGSSFYRCPRHAWSR